MIKKAAKNIPEPKRSSLPNLVPDESFGRAWQGAVFEPENKLYLF